MGLKQVRFATELRRLNKVGLDTSILIYHLEDIAPYAEGAVLGRTKATLWILIRYLPIELVSLP